MYAMFFKAISNKDAPWLFDKGSIATAQDIFQKILNEG